MLNKIKHMDNIVKFKDFDEMSAVFIKTHDKLIKENDINFISIKNSKIPLIILYQIIYTLFYNDGITITNEDVVILTLFIIGVMSREDSRITNILYKMCEKNKTDKYFFIMKNAILSIKNLLNIINKRDNVVIVNIEYGLKNENSIVLLNIIYSYLKNNKVKLKDFSSWFISNMRNASSKDLINYINVNF